MRNMTQAEKLAEYNKWKKLVGSLAYKAYSRLEAAGVSAMGLEDVESMMTESFFRAQSKFNPEFGVGISAYAGRAMLNDFNRVAEKLINERVQHGVRSVGEIEARMGEDDADLWEMLTPSDAVLSGSTAAMAEDPLEIVARRQAVGKLLERLSAEAQVVLQMVVQPSPKLQRVFELWTERLRARRAAGEVVTIPMAIDADFVMECMKLTPTQRRCVKKELAAAREVGRQL